MPTPARAIAALGLGLTAFVAATQTATHLAPGTPQSGLAPALVAASAIFGWRVLGRTSGEGYRAAARAGLRAGVYIGALALVYLGVLAMLARAARGRYADPFMAVTDILAQVLDIGAVALRLDVVAALFIGGFATGICAEWAARRWK